MNTLEIETDLDIAENCVGKKGTDHPAEHDFLAAEEDQEDKWVTGIHRRLLDLWDASDIGPDTPRTTVDSPAIPLL